MFNPPEMRPAFFKMGPRKGERVKLGDKLPTFDGETVKYLGNNDDRVYVDRGDALCSYGSRYVLLRLGE